MPRTLETTVYQFAELSERAQEKALDAMRDVNTDYEWWDFTYDDAKQCAKLIGIEIAAIYFSGFSSQGDGACFTGAYHYAKGAAKAIKTHAPQDAELHRIAAELQDVQRGSFYRLSAHVAHHGHYSHEMSASVSVYLDGDDAPAEVAETVTELLRDFMRWLYRRLESEYEYLTSDEAVRESIEANEYEFTEDGQHV